MKFIYKLFGWLFSNLFLILVVVALCYAYVYWDDPFGKDTPVGKVMAEFPEEISEAKTLFADITGMQIEDDEADAGQTSDGAESSEQASGSEDSDSAPATATLTQADSDQHTAVSDAEPPAASVSSTGAASTAGQTVSQHAGDPGKAGDAQVTAAFAPAAEFPDKGVAPSVSAEDETARAQKALVGDVFVPPEVEVALNQLHNDGSVEDVAVMQQADKPVEQLFIDARKAFYRRDYAASIAAYRQIIANDKDNYDAYGELGNVYFTKGDMELAAEAYYQAATIMVSQGHKQRAASLIGFLASVDEEKAKKLGEMLVPDDQQNAL